MSGYRSVIPTALVRLVQYASFVSFSARSVRFWLVIAVAIIYGLSVDTSSSNISEIEELSFVFFQNGHNIVVHCSTKTLIV